MLKYILYIIIVIIYWLLFTAFMYELIMSSWFYMVELITNNFISIIGHIVYIIYGASVFMILQTIVIKTITYKK